MRPARSVGRHTFKVTVLTADPVSAGFGAMIGGVDGWRSRWPMSDVSQGVGWWIASDGKWYPPELHPSVRVAPPPVLPFDLTTTASPTPVGSGPRPRRVSRRVVMAGSAILVALIALGATLAAVSGSGGPTYPAAWNPRVLGIVHFVEHERGLTFLHPVKMEFLGRAQFNKEVSVPQPHSAAGRTSLTRALQEMRALGLVHGNVNLAQSENQLQQSDVVGLYVPQKKTVFVRGSSLTPFVRVTLAHELTHALQDQHFDLTRLRSSTSGDDSALTALIEGDAVRVQNAYEQTLSAADQAAYQKESDQFQGPSNQSSGVPEILSDILAYPYAFGPTFVDTLVAQGGTTAIDNAFLHPPVAQAQIIDPRTYPVGWKPVPMKTPSVPAADRVTDPASPFGQLLLFEVLGSRLGYASAWNAVQGWQGDVALAYRDRGSTCDAIDVRMKTSVQSSAFAAAARQWASDAATHGVVRRSGRQTTIRSCDPGPDAPLPPTISPSAFDVLAARAQLIDGLMSGSHVDFALGACVSDQVVADLGPSRYSELLASTLSTGQRSQLRQYVVDGAITCRGNGVS